MTNTLSTYTESNNEDTEPQFADGLDKDGFPGGDRRFNVWPTTLQSAIEAVLEFVDIPNKNYFITELNELIVEFEQANCND